MQGVALCADVEVAERESVVAVVEEAVRKMAEADVVVVGLPCRGSCRRSRGAMVMTETRRGSRHGRRRCRSRRCQRRSRSGARCAQPQGARGRARAVAKKPRRLIP
jgi:hypothetical protein